ncbi:hypothetical protein K1W54_04455 [Micromonospora sp. CPCC 205371]|nr:hypothetical protein [Micromonospora sp. CPCC 205371]
MELIVCFLLAMVITGGRAVNDGIHAWRGTEPPHLTKARLRAQKTLATAEHPPSPRRGEPEATAGDVARAYWGGAMADLLEHREAARARRKQNRAMREAGAEVPKRPWWQPLAALGRLLVEPVGGRTNDDSGPVCPDCGRRTDSSGTCAVCVARARVEERRQTTRPNPDTDPGPSTSVVHTDDHTYCLANDCRTETNRHNDVGPPCPLGCGGRIVGYRYPGLDATKDLLCDKCGWLRRHTPKKPTTEASEAKRTPSTNQGDKPMAATGDVHDVESCDQQLGELDDDLDTINQALDTIDTAIGDARDATEKIEAFLRAKNADDTTVGGMAAALDALGPDAIKTLIDAIAAAKAGVAATREGLAPLREAKDLVGATDGSILNNR